MRRQGHTHKLRQLQWEANTQLLHYDNTERTHCLIKHVISLKTSPSPNLISNFSVYPHTEMGIHKVICMHFAILSLQSLPKRTGAWFPLQKCAINGWGNVLYACWFYKSQRGIYRMSNWQESLRNWKEILLFCGHSSTNTMKTTECQCVTEAIISVSSEPEKRKKKTPRVHTATLWGL